MQPTIKDIARLVGVSNPAVSAVLNGRTVNCRVSDKTRQKILAAAAELGYIPSTSAKMMRGAPSRIVGIVAAWPMINAEEHLNRILMALFERFNREQYSCFHTTCCDNVDADLNMCKELISRGVRHFVLFGNPVAGPEIEELWKKHDCTYIQYMGHTQRNISVSMNDALAEVWKGLSAEEKATFKMVTTPGVGNNRLTAIQALFPELPFSVIEERYLVYFTESISDPDYFDQIYFTSYRKTAEILRDFPDTRAIFLNSASGLLGAVRCAVDHGRRIGRDLTLIGVNYSNAFHRNAFPLTSVITDEPKMIELLATEVFGTGPFCQTVELQVARNLAWQTVKM